MSEEYQHPGRYVLPEGVGAIVPGRIAALIYRLTDLDQIRIGMRGNDPEADAVLLALRIAALKWRSSATGTEQATVAEPAASSQWLSTEQAAGLLGITPRAVRKAIAQQRLGATQVGRSWRVSREDIEQYRAARNGRRTA